MPTVNEQLAALSAEIVGIKGSADAVSAAAVNGVNNVAAAFTTRAATLRAVVYLDQISGSDTNPGTLALPVKTMQQAVDMVPTGGQVFIYVIGTYSMPTPVIVNQKSVMITSSNGARNAFGFDRRQQLYGATMYRELCNFRCSGMCSINFNTLRIVMPAVDGSWGSFPPTQTEMIGVATSGDISLLQTSWNNIDFEIPTVPFGSLITAQPQTLQVGSYAMVGGAASILGKIVSGVTAVGGTATPVSLTSNMTSI